MKNVFANLTDICPEEFNLEETSIASDNGLVPNRHQAIIWTKDGLDYWLHMHHLSSMS